MGKRRESSSSSEDEAVWYTASAYDRVLLLCFAMRRGSLEQLTGRV